MSTPSMSVWSMGLTIRDIHGPDRVARLHHYAMATVTTHGRLQARATVPRDIWNSDL
jgi:hypothetical protein